MLPYVVQKNVSDVSEVHAAWFVRRQILSHYLYYSSILRMETQFFPKRR
jgi:hypothetical protein